MPADEVTKLQAVLDALEKIEPLENPRVDLAAALKSGDAELAAMFEAEATFLKAFVAACKPKAAAVAEAASSGAVAPAAAVAEAASSGAVATAAAALLPLLLALALAL
jgi:hypothetical protein